MQELDQLTIKNFSEEAKEDLINQEGAAFLLSNWEEVVFIHYEVDPKILQREIPFPLDLFEGKAYVSLVAFTIKQLRFKWGGHVSAWVTTPFATHHYFNVRTYVRHNQSLGIYFMAEWLSKKICVMMGAFMYGLPYRYGYLNYENDYKVGHVYGKIRPSDLEGSFVYQGNVEPSENFCRFVPGSLGEFLGERYIAFAGHGLNLRYFRIWHKPWLQSPFEVKVEHNSLFSKLGPWAENAYYAGAHYSPGVFDVWIGKPGWLS